ELLRSPAERAEGAALLVVGPSGCGKSSLVRAGLLPVIADQPGWRILPPILPGADPVAALARELANAARRSALDWTLEHVHHQLGQRGLTGLADELLLAAPAGPQRHLLIVVDQFEELLTQTTPTERARFTELLRPALTGPVRVVATLRPEFLDQLLIDPELAALPTRTYTLRPLRREALRAVIERPAQLAGIDVDDGLVDRLVDDTDSGEALPLLAFTLAQLAEGVSRGGRLSSARYDQLGGVQGALTCQADAALTDVGTAGGRSREQVIAGLLRLVTVDEQGRPTRWRVHRAELPDHVVTELNAFVAHRLLTTDADNGTAVIGVAHEAFLSAWPPLAEAIAENVSALRARRAVEHAAAEWDGDGRARERLWGGGQLAGAVADIGARISADSAPPPGQRGPARWLPRRPRVLVTDQVALSPTAREFLHTSIRRDRFRRRRGVGVLSVLLILALVATGLAVDRQNRAQERQRVATARQLVAQAGTLLGSDPRTALRLGVAAERIHPSAETRGGLLALLSRTRYAGALIAHTDLVNSVAFSPDGRTLATATNDKTVILWDLTDPATPRPLGQPLTAHTDLVRSVAFSPDGRTLATASNDKTVIVWDLTDPARPGRPLTAHTDSVNSLAFAPDGRTLATASNDKTVILWDLTDPAAPRPLGQPLTGHTDLVGSVAFSPDGRTLATASRDSTAILWDLTNPATPRPLGQPLTAHSSWVFSVAFSPDGHTLTTTSADGTAILWDLTDPAAPHQHLTAHTGLVLSVAFAPDGHTLVTTNSNGTAILWDLTDPARPQQLDQPLTAHTGSVHSVAFAPDGHTLATASSDHTAILWDLTNPTEPRQLGQPLTIRTFEVTSSDFAPDGRTLATTDLLGTTILWDITDRAAPHKLGQPLAGHGSWVFSVVFSHNGHTLATAGAYGTVILWDLTDPAAPRQLGQRLTAHTGAVFSMAFAPDGRTLATAGEDHKVILWDLTEPAAPRPLGPPLTAHTGTVRSVALAPDGHTLATASDDRTAILWDLTDPTRPQQFDQPLTAHTGSVHSVAFSPDGRTLATASIDRTVILWDLTDPAEPYQLGPPLTAHAEAVTSVAFSPDGHTLATASNDRTVILWDLTDLNQVRDRAVERACSIAGGGLNRDEWKRYLPDLPYQDSCPV
ncbi:MAG: hypothetical protein ACRDTA_18885, partial [Pseudonocardiaceae bacterium]